MLPRPIPSDAGAREKLLYAAEECLLELGHAATSVKDIARVAGVNHGLVHHYFGSKEQLYVELLRYYDRVERAQLEQPLNEDQIVELINDEFFNDSRVMIEIHAMAHVMPELAKEMGDLLRHRLQILKDQYDANNVSAYLTLATFAGMALLADALKDLPLRDMVRQFLSWSRLAQGQCAPATAERKAAMRPPAAPKRIAARSRN